MVAKSLIAAATALALWAIPAHVAAQTTQCGIRGSTSASPVLYDPFNPTGIANTDITLTLTRVNNSGGGDTRIVNFYLQADPTIGTALDNATIVPTTVTGSVSYVGTGLNIFYNYAATPPTVLPTSLDPSSGNRFLKINFTGNNADSNTATVVFRVTLPPGLNLNASQNLSFDAHYGCYIQGGQGNGNDGTGVIANAVTFPITVQSALQAFYAGTALDFGEIGSVTTASLGGTPQRTSAGNYVAVRSSGAYNVTLSSANAFKLKNSGSTANDQIGYQLRFLGVNVNNTTNPVAGTVAITRSCSRAGVPSPGQSLYIQGTLLEGGQGKNPWPNYSDTLTVTVAPVVSTDPGSFNCASFAVP